MVDGPARKIASLFCILNEKVSENCALNIQFSRIGIFDILLRENTVAC